MDPQTLRKLAFMKLLPFLMCSLIFGVGCSALNVQKPTATVTSMAVQDVNNTGFTMNFGVDVTNPNSQALPLTAADYKVGLSGVNVVSGTANPTSSIPAGGTESISLPVTLTYDNLLESEQAIVQSGGNVPYNLDAGLSFDSGVPLLGTIRVPLQYNGTLAVKDIVNNPQALMQNPTAQKLAKELIGNMLFGH